MIEIEFTTPIEIELIEIVRMERPSDALSRCPDYDSTCHEMTLSEAQWCFEGCKGHGCMPAGFKGIGRACGFCPIIAKHN